MIIGAHQSAAGGPANAVPRAINDQCESLQIFTKNNNRWAQRMWSQKEANAFKNAIDNSDIKGVVSHSAYLINLCSVDPDTQVKSSNALKDELIRCQLLNIPYLVLHPGAPGKNSPEWGIETIAKQVNSLYMEHQSLWPDVCLLFENTAGQGSVLGWDFQQLHDIFSLLDNPELFGVCFDTCHAHAAGYDLTSPESYRNVFDLFDTILGLQYLKVFHLNDSLKALGSRVDRHANIGLGTIGPEAFQRLVNDPRFANHIAIIETPPQDGPNPFLNDVSILKNYRSAS